MTPHTSQTITLTDTTLTAMTTDALALTDLLTRTTNTPNPATIQRITAILDRLNASHCTLTHSPTPTRPKVHLSIPPLAGHLD